MGPQEREVLNFVLQIPSDLNPYDAVAHYLPGLLNLTPLAPWVSVMQWFTMVLYITMLLQALNLLRLRLLAHEWKLYSFSRIGLIQIEFSNLMSLVLALWPFLVIVDIILLQLSSAGQIDMSGEIILFGCKFLVAEIGSWSFVWVCACHCATHLHTSPSRVTRDNSSNTALNPIVRWGMNTTYVAVVVVSIFFVPYCYIGANTEYNQAKSILHGILDDLHSKASQFDPTTYSPLDMLQQLAPAKAMLPHIHQVARLTRHGIIFYYAILILLNLLYIPLLTYSLRYIYTQSEFERKLHFALKDIAGESHEKLEKKFFKSQNSRRGVLLQAIAWFLATFSNLSILTAQLCFRGDGFLKDTKWIRLTLVGLHLPPAILGNIILVNLIARSRKKKSSHANFSASAHYWIARCRVPSSVGHLHKQGPQAMRSHRSDQSLGKLGAEVSTARSSHEPLDQQGFEVCRAHSYRETLGLEVLREHSTDGPLNIPEESFHKEKLVNLVDIYTDLQTQEPHQTPCVDGTTIGNSNSFQPMVTKSPHQATFSCNE